MTKIKRFFLIFSPTELTCIIFISFLSVLIPASGNLSGNLGLFFAVDIAIVIFIIAFGLVCNAVPGILRFGEFWDVAGLIAPRHLCIVNGRKDGLFPVAEVEREVLLRFATPRRRQ